MTLLKIGHRGASALAPANTIRSLQAAVEAGVDMVEIDVIAAGGRLVLSHSTRELRPDAPSLEEGLDALPRDMPLLVDVKRAGYEGELVGILQRHGAVGRTFASTTDLRVLAALRALEPALARSVTWPSSSTRARVLRSAAPWLVPRMLLRVEASAATLQYRALSRLLVEGCHAVGCKVFAWTVNDRSVVARLEALGIDGVITDDPGVFAGSAATLRA